jgi:hypothetical protein
VGDPTGETAPSADLGRGRPDPPSACSRADVLHSRHGGAGGITGPLLKRLAAECRANFLLIGRREEPTAFLAELRAAGASGASYFRCDLADGPAVDRTAERLRLIAPRLDLLIHAAGIEVSRNLSAKTPEEIDRVYRIKVAGLVNLLDAYGEDRVGLVVSFSSVASLFGNPGQVDYAAANGFLNQFRGTGKARFLAIAWTAWSGHGMAARGPIEEILRSAGVDFIEPAVGADLFLAELNAALAPKAPAHRAVAFFGNLGENLAPPDVPPPRSPSTSPPCDTSLKEGSFGPPDPPLSATAAGPADLVPSVSFGNSSPLLIEVRPYLADHSLAGRPVLPAVHTVHRVRDHLLPAAPTGVIFEHLRFHAPLRFEMSRQPVLFLASEADGPGAFSVAAAADGSADNARCHTTGNLRHATQADRGSAQSAATRLTGLLTAEAPFETFSRPGWGRKQIYQVLFHGPHFQVLERTATYHRHALAADLATHAEVLTPHGLGGRNHWERAIEGGLHTAGMACLMRVLTRQFFLPHSIGRLFIDEEALASAVPTFAIAEYRGRRHERLGEYPLLLARFDVVVYADDRRPLVHLQDLDMVAGLDAPADPQTLPGMGTPWELAGHSVLGLRLDEAIAWAHEGTLPPTPTAMGQGLPDKQAGPSRLGRAGFLTPPEQAFFDRLTVPERRRDWLGGRVAAKLLLADQLSRATGQTVQPSDFSLSFDGGPPRVLPDSINRPPDVPMSPLVTPEGSLPPPFFSSPATPSTEHLFEPPKLDNLPKPHNPPEPQRTPCCNLSAFLREHPWNVSISHGAGMAWAVCGPRPVGIDIETLRDLPETAIADFLNPEERRFIPEHGPIALWTAKEAAAKTLGLGFALTDFRRLQISGFGYNEPYQITLDHGARRLQAVTFLAPPWVGTIVTEEEPAS